VGCDFTAGRHFFVIVVHSEALMKARILPALILTGVVLLGGWLFWSMLGVGSSDAASADESAEAEAGDALTVTLPEKKLALAGIEVGEASVCRLQPTRVVPGRLMYDDTRHIEVKVPTAGTLSDVRVKPGDRVELGDVLAVLSSPEVGLARADVLKRTSEAELARVARDRDKALCAGLKQLVDAVEKRQDASKILDDMEGVRLGPYREKIVSAYSRLHLAEQLAANIRSAAASGAVAERTMQERTQELNAAAAGLKGVTEESLYEAQLACATSELTATDADRRLRIAQQQVVTLLGYEETAGELHDDVPLSLVEVRAPFAGTIEAKSFSSNERVMQDDSLFVLAETSQLWVAADIREKEWPALTLQSGEALEVTSPALGEQTLTATLHFLGREVDPATNAVPLVATIQNSDGLLRPGQFVRVRLPMAQPREMLAVPSSAIVEHEGQPFVFVPVEQGSFRRVDITTGLIESGKTEVTQGLKPGNNVVTHGAFVLKSELLLESEE